MVKKKSKVIKTVINIFIVVVMLVGVIFAIVIVEKQKKLFEFVDLSKDNVENEIAYTREFAREYQGKRYSRQIDEKQKGNLIITMKDDEKANKRKLYVYDYQKGMLVTYPISVENDYINVNLKDAEVSKIQWTNNDSLIVYFLIAIIVFSPALLLLWLNNEKDKF